MKVGDIVEIAVPSQESQWLHGMEVGTKVRVHQVFEDEPRRMTVEDGGVLRMVLPSEVREVRALIIPTEDVPELPEASGFDSQMRRKTYTEYQVIKYAKDYLAAALPHILGEPVAWMAQEANSVVCSWNKKRYPGSLSSYTVPLYAPSIHPAEESENG